MLCFFSLLKSLKNEGYSLQFMKPLSILGNKFVTKPVVENCSKTVHVLVGDAECVDFLQKLVKFSYQ